MALDHAGSTASASTASARDASKKRRLWAKRLAEYPDPEQARREMTASQAVGRMGRPEEIAAAALYLASDVSPRS